jgi:hypothetical protein
LLGKKWRPEVRGGHFEPKNRTKPKITRIVGLFGFVPNKFTFWNLVLLSILVVYNPNKPKFNIVVYFDSNYDVTTLCFKLFFEFFHELVSYLL